MAKIYTHDELSENLNENKEVTGTNFIGSAGVTHRALDVSLADSSVQDLTSQELLAKISITLSNLEENQVKLMDKLTFFIEIITGNKL